MARRSRSDEVLSLGQITELVGGALHGDAPSGVRVTSVAELDGAGESDLVFVADQRRLPQLANCGASVALAPNALAAEAHENYGLPVIGVIDPHAAVAVILERLYPLVAGGQGISPHAVVATSAVVANGAIVGPTAVIDENATIGQGTEVGAGSYVGPGVSLGAECVIHPNVTIYEGTMIGDRALVHSGVVIGADGFGFARGVSEQMKIPQVGGVRIGDDVEIGANSCVDRGTLRETLIGDGTKIDNLVQIGHNCRIGRGCAISALTGLAGSTVIEDGVIMGGHVGTAGHQVIGAGSMLAAMAGVHGDLPAGSVVAGAPHMDIRVWRRAVPAFTKLPELLRRVRRLERRLDESSEE